MTKPTYYEYPPEKPPRKVSRLPQLSKHNHLMRRYRAMPKFAPTPIARPVYAPTPQ